MTTFYFYDLETSGISPRWDRIMQFAGQRTDMDLKPIGQPDNLLIKLSDDILPQPDAILTHKITPQKTLAEGITEREFLYFFTNEVVKQGTIFVGYNNIRFDDEFIRFSLWRNFFDAYEWQWKLDCSRWDLLDMVRMTRALRPDNIKWPFASDGRPSAKLELMAAVNQLDHSSVHDALSDVNACIALARLIKLKQPKLFDYLLNLRNKTKVEVLVNSGEPVVYTSGRYPSEFEKTTAALMVGPTADRPGALMYDLRIDPAKFVGLRPAELAKLWSARGPEAEYFPVKTLSFNRCPAVAPLNVLNTETIERLKLDMDLITKHTEKVKAAGDFAENLNKALEIMYPPRQPRLVVTEADVDSLLYEGFVNDQDRIKMSAVRAADELGITNFEPDFDDERLKILFSLYKARNFASALTAAEKKQWQLFRSRKLLGGQKGSQAARYFDRINELKAEARLSAEDKSILDELEVYGRTIVPSV